MKTINIGGKNMVIKIDMENGLSEWMIEIEIIMIILIVKPKQRKNNRKTMIVQLIMIQFTKHLRNQ